MAADELAKELHSTTDAAVWAQRFCERFSIYTDQGVVDDKWGLMVGWFANAIEVGRDAGARLPTTEEG
jgi:hypothetical protein